VVELAPSLLTRPRVAAFVAAGAAVGTWFVVAPHLAYQGHAASVAIVAAAVIPGTLLLVLIALPLWPRRWLVAAAVALALVALGCSLAGWGLPANFAKLWAAVFAGWAFLQLFEELSWVVLVALVIPVVDALSVWRGPTHAITTRHFEVYTSVAIAFVVPGGGAAYLGPPDILFYALFLATAVRWGLRVGWTWVAVTGIYSLTVLLANTLDVSGLPALPFLSFAFLAANADLLWRRLRRPHAKEPVSRADGVAAPPGVPEIRALDPATPDVVGVDGCRQGWATVHLHGGRFAGWTTAARFADVVSAYADATTIAVDMPIGLPPPYPREADREARRFVGPRASSVFSTPHRDALDAGTHAEASARHRELTGSGISRQAFALAGKILEVDAVAMGDSRVIEVHPEVSFTELIGAPPTHPKRDAAGRAERRRALAAAGIELPHDVPRGLEVDLIDAAVAAWSAARYATNVRAPLPAGHEERIGAIWR
jgi:predicted RNase H-like nuclease